MATFLNDTFTEATNTSLASHTGETGASWTALAIPSGATLVVSAAIDRIRRDATGGTGVYYASGLPASADYEVSFIVVQGSSLGQAGGCGRLDTGVSTGTFYLGRHSAGNWQIYKSVAGTFTQLGASYADAMGDGTSRTGKLRMVGDQISLYVDDVLRVGPVTDTAITAAGRTGVRIFDGGSDTTGFHIDSITAADVVAGGATVLNRLLMGVGT